MSANQLLSKALSTDSEDEAIACLKMARKKGLKLESTNDKMWEDNLKERLELIRRQRVLIKYLDGRLEETRGKMYSLEAWLILAAFAMAVELVVIIIMSNYG